jgi:hypothetical protein
MFDIWEYRSTHAGRQYVAGDSAAPDRHFFRADPAYGIGVARALGIDLEEFMSNGTVQLEAVAEKNNGKHKNRQTRTRAGERIVHSGGEQIPGSA